MKGRACVLAGVVLIAVSASIASAQRKVVRSGAGTIFRYNGDTIWTERDSSVRRVVYRGDTIARVTFENDRIRYTSVYVVNGETARLIDSRDSSGAQRTEEIGSTSPTFIVTSDREMLQSAIRSAARPRPAGREIPRFPAQPVIYAISNAVSITHHLDTALYVRGCIGKGKLDTTKFVFRGDTAVERLSPSRMFGDGMVTTLTSAMSSANLRSINAARSTVVGRSSIPAGPNRCDDARPTLLIGNRAVYSVGSIRRIHNDTMWFERDTMIIRHVFKGDTVERVTWLNNAQSKAVYVLNGDSAKVIDWTNLDGTPRTVSMGQVVPSSTVLMERRMMESQFEMADLLARSPVRLPSSSNSIAVDGLANPVPRPEVPAVQRVYDPSPDVRMLHLGDTIQYIRGCPPRTKLDTTVFILFGADSVKRVAPERMFGRSMVASFVGQMHMTGVRQSLAARDPDPAGLPRAPDLAAQCRR